MTIRREVSRAGGEDGAVLARSDLGHARPEPELSPDAVAGRVELLGRIAARGDRVASGGLPGRRAELVFAYLAAEHHRVVTQDELADALWPDTLPDSWAAALRSVITEVRRYLEDTGLGGAGVLTTARRGYRLQLPPDVVVDLDEARDGLARARALLDSGDGARAAALAGRSAALARLPFLPNHDGEWVDGIRRELESIHGRALDVEARAHRAAGDLAAAATAAERLVRADPFNEATHQLRIRILADAGDRAGAIRAYDHCRKVLAEELGVEPSPETEAVFCEAVRRAGPPAADAAPAVAPGTMSTTDTLEAGRLALARGAWEEAFARLDQAASEGATLTAQDLAGLGEAALWTGRHDESIAARHAAHAAYVRAGDRRAAARLSLGLVINYVIRLNGAVAGGWLSKARRHLAEEPECPEHGWLACTVALEQLGAGNLDVAIERAREGFRIGQRFDDADLIALGLTFEGFALVRRGDVRPGLDMLDEAMASASAGELSPLATGITYCGALCACFEMYDFRRALEWAAAIRVAADSTGAVGFPGDCRAHEAAVLIARGEWVKGEAQARAACAESETFDLAHTGLATYELGELQLRMGDLDQAEAFFSRAQELGMLPEPGRALLHLARGDAARAAASINAALAEVSGDRLSRTRLLPAAVDIALANGELDRARDAALELAASAEEYGATALRAASACATGAVALASGDPGTATSHLRRACRLWREADAPYETARARVRLAEGLAALGDAAGAALEIETARRQLQELAPSL